MMYNYPFFSFPHFRRYPTYYPATYVPSVKNQYNSNAINMQNGRVNMELKRDTTKNKNVPSNVATRSEKKENRTSNTNTGFSFLNNLFHQEDRTDDEEYFNLFGIKLYNDDLLLIGLIFFLYKEDVKDQYLFFALILLLLS